MTRKGAIRPAARGACRVCHRRQRLLKLGGYAVATHHRHGDRCAGSNRQPRPDTLRWMT